MNIPLLRTLSLFGLAALALCPRHADAQGNQPPVAQNDTVITQSTRTAVVIPTLLQNDSDPDGDALRISSVAPGGAGSVVITNNTTVTWTPNKNFKGTDTFLYEVSDARGGTAQGTVNVRNPFQLGAGTYAGTAEGFAPAHANAGYLVVTTTANGNFTGRVRIAGQTYSARGTILLSGAFQGELVDARGRRRLLNFQFPLTGKDQPITGEITGLGETSTFTLARNLFKAANPAPNVGYFTVKLPPTDQSRVVPQGIGYGTLRTQANGSATIAGKLGDGSVYSGSTFVRADGSLPVYAPMYRTKGSAFGSLAFSDGGSTTNVNGQAGRLTRVNGAVEHFRPARLSKVFYPQGFRVDLVASGTNYVAPVVNKPVLAVALTADGSATNADFVASNDGLVRPAPSRTYLGVKPAAGPYLADFARTRNLFRVRMVVNAKTGVFSGRFADRFRGKIRTFSGIFVQGENVGAGVFKGGRYSGEVVLTIDPAAPR